MSRRRWAGVQIPPDAIPKEETLQFKTFAGGFDSRDAQEDLPDGTSPDMRDMEVTAQDRLVPAPGVTAIDAALAHQPTQLLVHAGPNFASELLLLSAPHLGVYRTGSVQWQDSPDFEPGVYSMANYAGVALLSKGPGKLLFREALGKLGVIDAAPGGFAVGVFAGRVVLGGTSFQDSDVDYMRVVWNDSSGDYRKWSLDDGSADQVLIGSSISRADRIQAFSYLGFNTLAVMCRRSIWIGQPTGDVFQPIDFQLRLADTGCSYSETVIATEFGVLFLSDDGVRLFDGNTASVISDAINQQLLPTLDTDGRYSASFDPSRKRYYLNTPVATWVLDMLRRRWFRWCTAFRGSAFFPTQAANVGRTWADAVGTWGDQTGAWWQLGKPESGTGVMHFIQGPKLGFEDPNSSQALDTSLIPRWRSDRRVLDNQDRLVTHLGVRLTYEANASSDIEIQLPAIASGDFEAVKTATLVGGASLKGTRRAFIPLLHTGRGLGLGLRVISGTPHIRRASLTWQDNGEQIGDVSDIAFDDCSALDPDNPSDAIAVRITIDPAVTVEQGGTIQITAVVRDSSDNILFGMPLTWNSDNLAEATIDSSGLVTGVAASGTCHVQAHLGTLDSNLCLVTVVKHWIIHTFAGDGALNITSGSGNAEILIIAGGGSGGSVDGSGVGGGGGGAGGVIHLASHALTVGNYPITIGGGGVAPIADHTIGGGVFGAVTGNNGTVTQAFGRIAGLGGGGGCGDVTILRRGRAGSIEGGSGGGGGSGGDGSPPPGAFDGGAAGLPDYSESFGNVGGTGANLSTAGGAGGGGAGSPGANGGAGSGGAGHVSDIESVTGVTKEYAKGGAARSGTPGFAVVTHMGHGGEGGGQGLNCQGSDGSGGRVVVKYLKSTGIIATGGTRVQLP